MRTLEDIRTDLGLGLGKFLHTVDTGEKQQISTYVKVFYMIPPVLVTVSNVAFDGFRWVWGRV